MAAIEPGLRTTHGIEDVLRRTTRIAVVALYFAAVILALVLVRPAFRSTPNVGVPIVSKPSAPRETDVIRKHETVASFAARHGLELGDLLALNPRVDSLSLPPGTKLRVG
jgi:LysM repeat protein